MCARIQAEGRRGDQLDELGGHVREAQPAPAEGLEAGLAQGPLDRREVAGAGHEDVEVAPPGRQRAGHDGPAGQGTVDDLVRPHGSRSRANAAAARAAGRGSWTLQIEWRAPAAQRRQPRASAQALPPRRSWRACRRSASSH